MGDLLEAVTEDADIPVRERSEHKAWETGDELSRGHGSFSCRIVYAAVQHERNEMID
jgi:hypothetical protein